MNFHLTFCEPLRPAIIDWGPIDKESVIERFQSIPWSAYLQEMKGRSDDEIYYSPSFEIQNPDNENGLAISAVGEPDNFEFYIFYKRPKTVKVFFGILEKEANEHMTDITGQTQEDAIACIEALLNNDLEFLEKKIG
jgi:hypothetical protein